MNYQQLLAHYPIISDQIKKPALSVVLHELEKVLKQGTEGDVVEFGCYVGTTTIFLRRLLSESHSEKRLYAYDSFAGLPAKATQDQSGAGEQFKSGELTVSKKHFMQTFMRANLQPPITHKGWFKDIAPEQLPQAISYAFLDGDFYDSIIDSLRLVWPRLSAGGVITIDDYQQEALPGVERAVQDFFHDKPIQLHHEHNIAIIRPL